MAWSLLNHQVAGKVTELLDAMPDHYKPEERALSREQCESIIHAALWSYGSRSSSTASCYAFMNLMDAIGLKRWSFKDAPLPSEKEEAKP